MFSELIYLFVNLVFSPLGFWSGNFFLIAPLSDHCLLLPLLKGKCTVVSSFDEQRPTSRKPGSAKDMEEAFPQYQEMEKIRKLKRRPST